MRRGRATGEVVHMGHNMIMMPDGSRIYPVTGNRARLRFGLVWSVLISFYHQWSESGAAS